MLPCRAFRLPVAFACFVLPTYLGALEPTLDEIIVVSSKSEQRLRTISSNAAFLSEGQLQTIGHTHISEAMQRIPGTWISRGNGQEHLTAIRSPVLTGAGSCGAFLMTQDGISLRATGFCNVNELLESTSELASRVEIIRGPGSAVHGSNALHGVVNIITPEPEPLGRASIEAGPWDYGRGSLHLSSEDFRMDFSGTTDGGWKDESGFDQQKLLLKKVASLWGASITTTFSYTNLNQETAGFVQGDKAYETAGLRRDNPNPQAYRDARSYRLISTWRGDWRGGVVQVRPYLRRVDTEFLQHFLPGQPVEENGHHSMGIQSLWTNPTANWRTGLEVEFTDGFLKETQPFPTRGSAFLAATIPAGKHYDYEIEATVAAVFLDYRDAVTEKLSVNAGLRYEYMKYDYNNRMIDGQTREDNVSCGFGGCRFSRPADRSDIFDNVSPALGMIYNLSDNHQIYGQLARGFRAPQATELYRLQGGQSVSGIDSEELDSVEAGFRGQTGSLSYDLSLFAMRKNNFIFRDTHRRNIDNGKTSHRGIEIAATWRLGKKLRTGWAFTWARHTYENNPALSATPVKGNDMDTAPETLGSATLTWTPTPSTSLELEWVHIGDYYTDPQNRNRYEGHNLVHLRGSFSPSAAYRIFFRVMNLTDEDYAERADFGFGNERYFVGTPLAAYLGVAFDF